MRCRHDDGALIVEAALVLPILLALFVGLFEYSVAEFEQSQATSAARDGARVGILDYRTADVPGSAANSSIVDAVEARLTGRSGADLAVDVECLDAGGTVEPCADVASDGYVMVDVSWLYDGLTLLEFTTPERIEGRSRMALVGATVSTTSVVPPSTSSTTSTSAPTTSTTLMPPGSCALSRLPSVSAPEVNRGSGKLTDSLRFTDLAVNGAVCGTPTVRVWPSGGGTTGTAYDIVATPTSPNVYQAIIGKNDISGWAANVDITFQVLDVGGDPIPYDDGRDVYTQFEFRLSQK